MMDPPNVFKDAVCGLFQAPWRLWIVKMTDFDVALPWYDIPFSVDYCQLACNCILPLDGGSFKCIQRCSWRAVPGRHDSSEWFTRYTLMLYCFNMTSSSQLTIVNSRASCLPPIDDGSFKCLQKCSWRAVQGHHDSSECFKWHALMLSCLNMTSHSQLTIAN